MRTKLVFVLMLMVLAFSLVNAQNATQKHRGVYPRLLENGKVIDLDGKQLGLVAKDGKVCDAAGTVIGIISPTGEVAYASQKGIIGVIEKNVLKTKGGYVISTDADGAVTVSGKLVAFVDLGYSPQSYGCVLHCFFNINNKEANDVEGILNQ
jgi:hypothetical protein